MADSGSLKLGDTVSWPGAVPSPGVWGTQKGGLGRVIGFSTVEQAILGRGVIIGLPDWLRVDYANYEAIVLFEVALTKEKRMKNEDRVLTAFGTGTIVEVDFMKVVGENGESAKVFRVELDNGEFLPISTVIRVLP